MGDSNWLITNTLVYWSEGWGQDRSPLSTMILASLWCAAPPLSVSLVGKGVLVHLEKRRNVSQDVGREGERFTFWVRLNFTYREGKVSSSSLGRFGEKNNVTVMIFLIINTIIVIIIVLYLGSGINSAGDLGMVG